MPEISADRDAFPFKGYLSAPTAKRISSRASAEREAEYLIRLLE
jgi:hypothetical protein